MKKKDLKSGLFLIILAVLAVIARIYYVNSMMAEVSISENIYNAAKVNLGANGLASVFVDGINMQSLYISNLYFAFLIFGNYTVAGVYLNILYQVITVLMVYVIIRNISNKYIGLAAGVIAAVVPPYIDSLAQVNILNMEIFIGSIICAIASFIARILYNIYRNKKKLPQKQIPAPESIIPVVEPETSAIPDTSMKEIVLDDLEEKEKKVQYIENPLPVPKRREHKEMDFAFEPAGSDDYDLKDMTGIDFYDIE